MNSIEGMHGGPPADKKDDEPKESPDDVVSQIHADVDEISDIVDSLRRLAVDNQDEDPAQE